MLLDLELELVNGFFRDDFLTSTTVNDHAANFFLDDTWGVENIVVQPTNSFWLLWSHEAF